MIYLDNAASTKISEEARDVMLHAMSEYYANPSSLHDEGIKAKKALNIARKSIAECLHVPRKSIIFTGSGTEANNHAIKGLFNAGHIDTIITSTIEHHSVMHAVKTLESRGANTIFFPVNQEGYLDLEKLDHALETNKNCLVSIIYANNETGTVQDIKSIHELVKKHDAFLHLDMVQVPLHLPINLETLNCDFASFSAHKFHGPRGVGILYAKDLTLLNPIIDGGQHEFNKRAGTENLPAIMAMATALENTVSSVKERETKNKITSTYFLEQLKKANIDFHLNGPNLDQARITSTLNIGFKHEDAQSLSFGLNQQGIYVTLGSACDSESVEPSHVLKAMKIPEDYIHGSLRFSLSHETSKKDIDDVVNALKKLIK